MQTTQTYVDSKVKKKKRVKRKRWHLQCQISKEKETLNGFMFGMDNVGKEIFKCYFISSTYYSKATHCPTSITFSQGSKTSFIPHNNEPVMNRLYVLIYLLQKNTVF
jgi:hypothetical protein